MSNRRARKRRSRVIVNGRWLSKPTTGTGRYSTEVLRRLLEGGGAARIALWVPSDASVPAWMRDVPVRRFRARGQLFEQVALPLASIGRCVLSMAGPAPMLKRKQVAVLHDATPFRLPATYSRTFGAWYRLMYRWLAVWARQLATVSHFSAKELASVLPRPEGAFTIAPPASSDLPESIAPARMLPDRFLLTVGTLAVHKNLLPAVSALIAAGMPVVVVGDLKASAIFESVGLADSPLLVRLGRVDDATLHWLYQNALALVFPSLYEGFGLPVLEAQHSGCAVISTDRASLPEVLGDSALLVDPTNDEQLVNAAQELWASDELRRVLVEKGRSNAARFSWELAAERLLRAVDLAEQPR